MTVPDIAEVSGLCLTIDEPYRMDQARDEACVLPQGQGVGSVEAA